MPTPQGRINNSSTLTHTATNAVANNAYCNSADVLRIQQSSLDAAFPVCDFRLTGVNYSTAPVAGSIQLAKIPRDLSGNQGPTPSASMIPTQVWTFGPTPSTSNATKIWVMSIDAAQIDIDADYWLFNNGTGQSLPTGWIISAIPWSLGS
jgi:hypothetical protein